MAPFLPTTLRFTGLSATPASPPAFQSTCQSTYQSTSQPEAATPHGTLAKGKPTELWPARLTEQRMVSSRSYRNALAALLNGSVSTIGSRG